jgi:small neutral amino acid transporter SnatA (MarC family)
MTGGVRCDGLVLVAFALVGKGLLGLLHVSLPALRTAGGVLLMSQAAGNPWHIADVLGVLALCLLLAALAMQYVFDGLNEGLLKRLT